MNQQKSINLYLKGVKSWNSWALKLLKTQKQLQSTGLWQVKQEFDFDLGFACTKGLNEESQIWLDLAFVDLSCLEFKAGDSTTNKSKARKRLDLIYLETRKIPVSGVNIDFRDFIFPGDAIFNNSEFLGVTLFNKATLHGTAWFANSVFADDVWFKGVDFKNDTNFHQVEFERLATFEGARFKGSANFEAINASRSFNLSDAAFTGDVPSFMDAEFKFGPRLQNIAILPAPTPRIFSRRIRENLKSNAAAPHIMRRLIMQDIARTQWCKDMASYTIKTLKNPRRNRSDETHFRALQRIAKKADDAPAERQFFASQVRARRNLKDKLHDFPGGFFRYIYGAAYELTSDFGCSLVRPAVCWAAIFVLFFGANIMATPASLIAPCQNTATISPIDAANTLTWYRAFPFVSDSRKVDVDRAITCLKSARSIDTNYLRPEKVEVGTKDQSRMKKVRARLSDAPVKVTQIKHHTQTEVKFTASVASNSIVAPSPSITSLGLLQTILHLTLLGLFLLALRNHLHYR